MQSGRETHGAVEFAVGKTSARRINLEKSAPAEIRTRVPRSGGEGDIHYTTRASPGRRRAHMNVLHEQRQASGAGLATWTPVPYAKISKAPVLESPPLLTTIVEVSIRMLMTWSTPSA